jgi:hypothetical protein
MGVEEAEEIQTKGTYNQFNRKIAENLPNPKKESPRCRNFTETKPSGPKQEHPQIHHNQNIQHTEQRVLKAAKDKRQVTCKGRLQ